MENLISKELLSEVLGVDIRKINNSILDGNLYYYKTFVKCKSKINIYELGFKVKEWSYSKCNEIISYTEGSEVYQTQLGKKVKDFYADSELKAIIKAAEWVRLEDNQL